MLGNGNGRDLGTYFMVRQAAQRQEVIEEVSENPAVLSFRMECFLAICVVVIVVE